MWNTFELVDNENLLQKHNIDANAGVCVALVEKEHPDLKLETHHNL